MFLYAPEKLHAKAAKKKNSVSANNKKDQILSVCPKAQLVDVICNFTLGTLRNSACSVTEGVITQCEE